MISKVFLFRYEEESKDCEEYKKFLDALDKKFAHYQDLMPMIHKRNARYGGMRENGDITREFVIANQDLYVNAEPEEKNIIYYLVFMIGAKLARFYHIPEYEDNIDDIIGYCIATRWQTKGDIILKPARAWQEPIIDRANALLKARQIRIKPEGL